MYHRSLAERVGIQGRGKSYSSARSPDNRVFPRSLAERIGFKLVKVVWVGGAGF